MKGTRLIFAVAMCLGILLGLGGALFPAAEAAEQMRASDECVEFIKGIEGFAKYPYYDYSQYTVGYGTRCPAEKLKEYQEKGITREEAEVLLRQYITEAEEELNQRILEKYDLELAQHEFDALVSLSFNVGTGWVWGSQENCLKSVVVSRAGERAVVYAFSLYANAGGKVSTGLVVRRLCEANLFLNGVYEKRVDPDFGYVLYDAAGGSVTYNVQGFLTDGTAVPAADARRKDASFLGWYTEPDGGTRVTELTGELSGRTLYAHWQLEDPLTQPEQTEGVTVKVTGDVVNLRKGPGTDRERIGRAYRGDVLTVTSVAEATLLRWGETEKGWICLDYTDYGKAPEEIPETQAPEETVPETEPVQPSAPEETLPEPEETVPPRQEESSGRVYGTVNAVGGLRVRKGPGTGYAMAGSLWNGNRVEILEVQTNGGVNWGRTELGWICMDYVTLETATEGETQPEAALRGRVKADLLRVRSGPGTNYKIVGFYANQEDVEILEQVLGQDGYWGKTRQGWVRMDYIETAS